MEVILRFTEHSKEVATIQRCKQQSSLKDQYKCLEKNARKIRNNGCIKQEFKDALMVVGLGQNIFFEHLIQQAQRCKISQDATSQDCKDFEDITNGEHRQWLKRNKIAT